MFQEIAVSSDKDSSSRGPFVYGFIDLFSGSGESWHWGLTVDDSRGINSSSKSHTLDGSKVGYEEQAKKLDKITKPSTMQDERQGPLLSPIAKLDTLEEENEDDDKSISSTDSSISLMEELVGNGVKGKREVSNTKHCLHVL